METNIILTLLFGGVLPAISLISGIKIFRTRLKIKTTQKALGAVAHHIPPELATATGTALAGPAGGAAVSAGLSVVQNMTAENKTEHKQQHNRNIRWNSNSRNMVGNQSQNQGENKPNLEKEKNKRKGGILSGVRKAVGGAVYMGAELGEKSVDYAGNKLKGTIKEMDDIMGISRGINKAKDGVKNGVSSVGNELKGTIKEMDDIMGGSRGITTAKRFIGTKVFKAKEKVNEKILQPIKEIARKVYNSKPIKGARGVVRKTGNGIVAGYRATKNTVNTGVKIVKDKYNDLMEWKKRITDPEQSLLIQRVNSIIDNGAKLRGRIEKYADDNTNGYGIMQEGIEEIKSAKEQRKEEREAKKKEKKAERKAKQEEEKANGTNIGTRVAQKFRPQARYTAIPQQVVIINNANSTPNTDVKVNITDANLNNLYNLNNTHYKVVINPLKGTEGLLEALNDPKNFGMSAKQIMTYQTAKSRITERESDYGSKLPEGYYLEEKLRYLKKAIKMAPGLTADQATLVTEKAIEEKIKNESEKRKKAIYAAYKTRDYVGENRKVIENILRENPTFENQLKPFIEESYENVQLSPKRTEEIQAQVNQYYSGQVQDFGELMTSEEIEIIKSEMGSSSPEEQAKVIEEELFKREKKNIAREQIMDEISQDPNGVVTHTVFSSDDFQKELTTKLAENYKEYQNEVGKAIELDRQKRIEQIKKEEGVTLYEAASRVEAEEQEHYIEEAIKQIAPKVEIKQTKAQPHLQSNSIHKSTKVEDSSQRRLQLNATDEVGTITAKRENKGSSPSSQRRLQLNATDEGGTITEKRGNNGSSPSSQRRPQLNATHEGGTITGKRGNNGSSSSSQRSLQLNATDEVGTTTGKRRNKGSAASSSSPYRNVKLTLSGRNKSENGGIDVKSILERNKENEGNINNAS